MDEPTTDPTPAKPPRRRLRRVLIGSGVVLLVLAALVWFAPTIVAKTGLRQTVVARFFPELKGTIHVGDASLGWLSPVELRDVTVTDPSGRPALTAARVVSSHTLLDLARNNGDLGTFTIESPVLTVVCEAGTTNVEQAIAGYLVDDGTPPAPERTGLVVTVTGGKVLLSETGREGEQTVEPLDLTVTVPRPRSEPVTLDGSAGTLKAAAVFASPTRLTVDADRFAVESLGPLLRRFTGDATSVAGQLTTALKAEIGDGRLSVDGRAALAALDLTAPWLGQDRVRLQRVEVPGRVELIGEELRVAPTTLTCDAGTARVAGVVNLGDSIETLIAREGLSADADVDLAKLAAVLPRLLRLQPGTEVREGRVKLHLASKAGEKGTLWDGTVSTTALRGVRDGKPLVWEQPLRAEFLAHRRADGTPVFDKLECQSDFVGLAARGSPDAFVAAANLNLDRLSARLGEFVDFGGTRLGGTASIQVQTTPRAGGGHTLVATAKLARFALLDTSGRGLREPDLTVTLRANARLDANGPIRVEAGEATGTAGADELRVRLQEPIADLRAATTGTAAVTVTGDVSRWRQRLGAFVMIPRHWAMTGAGTVTGVVTLTADGVAVERASADLKAARFLGAGLDITEPWMQGTSGVTWAAKTDVIAFTDATVKCPTVTLTSPRVEVKPDAKGDYRAAGTATVANANLAGVQRTLILAADPKGADRVAGTANGTVTFDVTGSKAAFDVNLDAKQFALGPATKPTWSETWVKLAAAGEYDFAADAAQFRTLTVARDGFSAAAKGTLAKMSTLKTIAIDGTITYDLAKVEPALKRYLGQSAEVEGKDTRPFKLTGNLGGVADSFAVNVGAPTRPAARKDLTHLSGNAAVAWTEVKAFGFTVGPSELKAALDRDVVTLSPVAASFGGGTVRLRPTVRLAPAAYDLRFEQGRVVEKAKLTPAACADALGYALPAIANVAQADGLVSLDLGENVVPLTDPTAASVSGRLTIHTATLSAGPVVTQLATLFGADRTQLTLAKEQVVGLRVEKGRVHHENFALTIGGTTVRTTGSVGFDGSLSIVVELPMPRTLLEKVPANPPLLREYLAKRTFKIPVGGTVKKPQVDGRAFNAAVQEAMKAGLKNAAGQLKDDLIKKGKDKLLDELRRKFEKRPPEPKK